MASIRVTCATCAGKRVCCPGCSGFADRYPKLFMGCGVLIRCPKCVGREFALADKTYLQLNLGNDDLVDAYYEKMRAELLTRFPGESFDDV